jgi:futalosine hydrolase
LNQLFTKFDPQIETMEGAALHYICLQENVPFLQLRSISNYVGERNKEKWKLKEAIDNLNEALVKIVDKLTV